VDVLLVNAVDDRRAWAVTLHVADQAARTVALDIGQGSVFHLAARPEHED